MIRRYVEVGYSGLLHQDQEQMAVEHLLRLFDRLLQRHMLNIQPATLEQAVLAIEEYQSVGGTDGK